jgi:hypothetical protein
MKHNFRLPPVGPWQIALTLVAYALLLILASCASVPQTVPVPCPQFPVSPLVTLPEVGYFHKRLDKILQTISTSSQTTPTTR